MSKSEVFRGNSMTFTRFLFACVFLLFLAATISAQDSDEPVVVVEQQESKLVVNIEQGAATELFTEYRFADYAKPILYPVMAAGNVPITRHYPMDEGHSDEAQDHPHHKSLWFAHG
ncbi:MAG: DUF6807 family protein, partial [Pirellulaceae bacterium]